MLPSKVHYTAELSEIVVSGQGHTWAVDVSLCSHRYDDPYCILDTKKTLTGTVSKFIHMYKM